MNSNKTKKIVLVALFTALVCVATMSIKIPTANGYIHLGDTLVYLSGIFLGPIFGPVAAGIGSLLADILSGYPAWAIPSLIIKALDAFVFGLIFKKVVYENQNMTGLLSKYVVALLLGGSIMVGGYFITGVILYSYPGAVASIIPNIIQALGGGIIGYPIFIALSKQKAIQKML